MGDQTKSKKVLCTPRKYILGTFQTEHINHNNKIFSVEYSDNFTLNF